MLLAHLAFPPVLGGGREMSAKVWEAGEVVPPACVTYGLAVLPSATYSTSLICD